MIVIKKKTEWRIKMNFKQTNLIDFVREKTSMGSNEAQDFVEGFYENMYLDYAGATLEDYENYLNGYAPTRSEMIKFGKYIDGIDTTATVKQYKDRIKKYVVETLLGTQEKKVTNGDIIKIEHEEKALSGVYQLLTFNEDFFYMRAEKIPHLHYCFDRKDIISWEIEGKENV